MPQGARHYYSRQPISEVEPTTAKFLFCTMELRLWKQPAGHPAACTAQRRNLRPGLDETEISTRLSCWDSWPSVVFAHLHWATFRFWFVPLTPVCCCACRYHLAGCFRSSKVARRGSGICRSRAQQCCFSAAAALPPDLLEEPKMLDWSQALLLIRRPPPLTVGKHLLTTSASFSRISICAVAMGP